jgi:hypothetical protein
MYIHDWYHSNVSGILLYTRAYITIYMAHSPCFLSPLAASFCLPLLPPLCSPFDPLSLTWNPPSCDRICPPRSQIACKLTPLDPPSPQPSPFKIPSTPNTLRLTKTTSGTTRHLLSGTVTFKSLELALALDV